MLLATGYTPDEIVDMYQKELPRSTVPSTFNWRPWLPFLPSLSTQNKEDFLARRLGRSTTLNALHKYVMVTSFDLEGDPFESETSPCTDRLRGADDTTRHWQPTLFTNLPQGDSQHQCHLSMTLLDVTMRATAAPVYNAIYQVC